eukprot:CAMPEP_0117737466 /NCGR_PEP_ID=MMETSP0947-20121206/2555_1 /TAXON_ID=44440 /ORGANISM="Chattonella subsalsa, Strain CCMP2191" /LENGTH=391 /DNA_ID=CAMNT_0005552979 /DNA_START=1825 /DNA_END=2997 /DNA_ORIENTATION=-
MFKSNSVMERLHRGCISIKLSAEVCSWKCTNDVKKDEFRFDIDEFPLDLASGKLEVDVCLADFFENSELELFDGATEFELELIATMIPQSENPQAKSLEEEKEEGAIQELEQPIADAKGKGNCPQLGKHKVVPVRSLPMRVVIGHDESFVKMAETVRNVRWIPLPGLEDGNREQGMKIMESPAVGGFFGVVWDCGIALSIFLGMNPEIIRGKDVLELGAGTGIVSIACALLGASWVLATDRSEIMPLLSHNVLKNCGEYAMDGVIEIAEYDWGRPLLNSMKNTSHKPDVVLCSDVLFDPADWENLWNSILMIANLVKDEGQHQQNRISVYFAHRQRHELESSFFTDQIRKNNNTVVVRQCSFGENNPNNEDTDEYSTYHNDEVMSKIGNLL